MAFLRAPSSQDVTPVVRGRGVALRPLVLGDYGSWAELRASSREHLSPWEPVWGRDELTRSSFRRRLRHYAREAREDLGYAFAIMRENDDQLIGGLTLSNVRRGVTQAAALGYWLGRPYVGQGHMSAAVQAVLPYAFFGLKLHRLEAASMPTNLASIRVLEKSGFTWEGFARRYLKINGVWEDHFLFARLAEDGQMEHVAGGDEGVW
ncbi:MAG: GNAT family N-acetyltransferase [Hyphomicrobiaceae bacterium]